MAFIREDAGVVESPRGIDSAQESKAISQTERDALLFEEEEEMTLRRERMAC
jgi:hypothetical protein